jgi:hypothetical protein
MDSSYRRRTNPISEACQILKCVSLCVNRAPTVSTRDGTDSRVFVMPVGWKDRSPGSALVPFGSLVYGHYGDGRWTCPAMSSTRGARAPRGVSREGVSTGAPRLGAALFDVKLRSCALDRTERGTVNKVYTR